jgi:hypothetical protein
MSMKQDNPNPASSADLGPLLYGERVHNTPAVIYTVLGIAFVLIGLLCAFVQPPNPKGEGLGMLIPGLVVALGGAVCLTIGLIRLLPTLGASWQLHQRGIRFRKGDRERVLRYEEIDELTRKVVRVFLHGVCTGEVHDVTLTAHRPDKSTLFFKHVRRPKTVSGADLNEPGAVEKVCEQIAALIAQGMEGIMQRGEAVPWGRDLQLRPEGLESVSPRSGMERIAWQQIERVGIEEGVFRLWRRGAAQPVLKIPTHFPNFLPGYLIILNRTNQHGRL